MNEPRYFKLPECPACHFPAVFPLYDWEHAVVISVTGEAQWAVVGWQCILCGEDVPSLSPAQRQQFETAEKAWDTERPATADVDDWERTVRVHYQREQEKVQRLREGRW